MRKKNREDGRSVVDITAMANTNHQHLKLLVLELAENTVIIDPEAPELAEITLEAFAEQSRILAACDP